MQRRTSLEVRKTPRPLLPKVMDAKDERALPAEDDLRSVEREIRSAISSKRVNVIRGKAVLSNM